jgi:hypothetical protein
VNPLRKLLVLILLGYCTTSLGADLNDFGKTFEDATLRIDLNHTGDAKTEIVALDRLYRQGIWAGSRKHLIDPNEVGRYVAELTDPKTGSVLFRKRFDSYFGEYRTTTEAAKGQKKTYSESVLVPYPKHKVNLVVKVRKPDQSHATLLESEIDPGSFLISRESLIPGVAVIPVTKGGDPHGCVDVVIIAEGYTKTDEAKLKADLNRFAKILLSAEPFVSSKDKFNIVGAWKPSLETGCDEPSRGIWRNTVVGTTFDSLGSERYLLTEENRAMRDIAAHVPYDAIYIMVNQPRYGGGGIYNLYCTFTSDNQWAPYIFVHEFGHSFAGLADEYYTSSTAYNDFYPKGVEPNEPNITALLDPANLKWRDLITSGIALPTPWEKDNYDHQDTSYQKTRESINQKIAEASRKKAPQTTIDALKAESEKHSLDNAKSLDEYLAKSKFVGKVGAFEGAGYTSKGMYRPALDCIMFSKGTKPFCPVCERALRKMIEHYGE